MGCGALHPQLSHDDAPFLCMDLSYADSLLVNGFKLSPESQAWQILLSCLCGADEF